MASWKYRPRCFVSGVPAGLTNGGRLMAAPMEKTRHPGIYKRGARYVVVYRVDGRQRKESARTLDEARRLKAARMADRDRGEFHDEQSRVKFRDYAEEWIERYQGTGRRGFTEDSRDDYRRDLERYAYPVLRRAAQPHARRDHAARRGALDRLAMRRARAGTASSPTRSVRRSSRPVRSCLGHGEARGTDPPQPGRWRRAAAPAARSRTASRRARAFTREQLALFLRVVHPRLQAHVPVRSRRPACAGPSWRRCGGRDLELDGARSG